MSNAKYWLEKAKLGNKLMDKSKREKPNYADELALGKSLVDIQDKISKPKNEIEMESYKEIEDGWKNGRPGGAGSALISGLKSGLKQRSILDDETRMKKFMDATEKMQGMVEKQNMQIAEQQRLEAAGQAIKPRLMAFLDQSQRMAPEARDEFLRNTLQEYNNLAGTDYKFLTSGATEPWKVTVSDGYGDKMIDLMDIAKTPEEKRYELFMNSNEMKIADRMASQEYNMSVAKDQSIINSNNARANKYGSSQNGIQEPIIVQAPNGAEIDVSSYPQITTAREKNMYSQTFTGTSKVLRELEDTYKEVEQLESMTKNNLFQPFGSQLGSLPNKLKDFTAKNPNADQKTSEEVILRNKVESRFQQLQPVLEKALKGSAPDAQLLKRMHEQGVYPEPNQPMPVIKEKLRMLMKTVKEDRDIAGTSLKAGRQIPFFPEILETPQQEVNNNQSQQNQQQQEQQQTPNKEALLIRKQQLLERRNQLLQGQQ